MIRRGPWRATVNERHREVARALAEERLAGALGRLGPVFTHFGLYLASRPDLLSAGECLELADLPDRREPLPATTLLDLLGAEWGRPALEVLADLDERPRQSRLLSQEHRARLAGGEAVIVRVLRPGLEQEAERDLPLLGSAPGALATAVATYRETLANSLDLTAEATGLEALALDMEEAGLFCAPRVHRRLTTPRVLVFQDLGGVPLDGGWDGSGDLPHRLCLTWLRQALQGRAVPIEPRNSLIEVLPGGHVIFTGGLMAWFPAASQANFRSYLAAAAKWDPDEVCGPLLREMTRDGPAASEERLRLRLRQAVPFRDGGWNAGREVLAEHLFLHWRFAHECGYRPRIHLAAFFRGLATVATEAHRLAPDRDALLQGLEEFRLTANIGQVSEMMALDRLGENLERYAALMAGLPEQIDKALTVAATGKARDSSPRTEARERRRQRNMSMIPAVSCLALAAIALMIRQLAPAISGGLWIEKLGAVVFLALGALVLRTISKM